jgi:putative ABC transport system permease protein
MRIPLRSLVASRAFAMTAIATIALAISLAATVFAVVDGVLFKPLPYPSAEQLYRVSGTDGSDAYGPFAAADLEYLQSADARIAITPFSVTRRALRHAERPDVALNAVEVAADFFDVLGQRPLVGGFRPEHFRATSGDEAEPAIVSYLIWRDRLGSTPSAIGQVIGFLDARLLVVGVLPHDFVFPESVARWRPDFFVPLIRSRVNPGDRWSRPWFLFARFDPALSSTEGKAKLDAALMSHSGEYPPRGNQGIGPYTSVVLHPLNDMLGRSERPLFSAAFAGAALLVLLACVSAAGLLTARTVDRQRELSVRASLGATHRHLLWLGLTEVWLLASFGAIAGLLIAQPLLSLALTLLPESLVLLKPPRIDLRVVAFALAAAVATMTSVSAISLRSSVRHALANPLAGIQTAMRVRSWTRTLILSAQSAIGLVLVLAGALVLASFVALRTEDPGIDPNGLAVIEVLIPGLTRAQAPDEWRARHAAILARIQALPGVNGVATAATPLMENSSAGSTFASPPGATRLWVNDVPISGTFFAVTGLAVLDGRLPTPDEIDAGRAVAVVSDRTARAYWPGRRAVGETLQSRSLKLSLQVVAVVEEARFSSQAETTMGELYLPAAVTSRGTPLYFVKTARTAETLAREVALAINHDVQGVVVRRAQSFDDALASSVKLQRFRGVLFAVVAGVGLVLFAVGIGGLVAMGVARRVREIGIRATLGAGRSVISRMIVLDHLRPVIAGSVLGLVASWWTTKLLSGFLYGFTPHDPFIWAAASALLLMVAMLSAWVPARRASAVDPAVILRVD